MLPSELSICLHEVGLLFLTVLRLIFNDNFCVKETNEAAQGNFSITQSLKANVYSIYLKDYGGGGDRSAVRLTISLRNIYQFYLFTYVHSIFEILAVAIAGVTSPYGASPPVTLIYITLLDFDLMMYAHILKTA